MHVRPKTVKKYLQKHDMRRCHPSPGCCQKFWTELSFVENKKNSIGLSKFFSPGIKKVTEAVIIAVIIANLKRLFNQDILIFFLI